MLHSMSESIEKAKREDYALKKKVSGILLGGNLSSSGQKRLFRYSPPLPRYDVTVKYIILLFLFL